VRRSTHGRRRSDRHRPRVRRRDGRAATTNACKLITASEYKQVLGRSGTAKLGTGEGTSTCYVTGAGPQIVVQLGNSPTAAQFEQWMSMPNVQKIPSLGPYGFSVYRAHYGISVYAAKGTVQVVISGKGMSKAQAKLTSLALRRI
jgi:hypothetical protein